MPIPDTSKDISACVKHFISKGRPRDQAVAICLDVQRRRRKQATDGAIKKTGAFKHKE